MDLGLQVGLLFLVIPDKTLHNFRASRSGDRRFLSVVQGRRATDYEVHKAEKMKTFFIELRPTFFAKDVFIYIQYMYFPFH